MPNVVDMTREAAWKLLGEIQNINVVEQSEASAYVEKGNVTRTDPKVGTQLVPGQNVVVYVSSGPATAVMPSVVGLYSQTAQKQLADLGFTNVRTETVKSDRPKGEVVYQSVQKDTVLKLEDEIVLRLSDESGTQPTETQPPTETTEETEKTLTVRFTVPNKEEP